MTVTLYRKGGKRKVQGHLVTMLVCAEDRVEELCAAGWARSPREAYAPPKPVAPEPEKYVAPKRYKAPKKKKSASKSDGDVVAED